MFGFGLFDGAIERECAMIMSAGSAVRQNYSWFLDERSQTDGRHLTNAGWSEWTAAMCGPRAVDDLYQRIMRFCRETPDRWALSDYYNAVDGRRIGFEGRAQMGGFAASVFLKQHPKGLLHLHQSRGEVSA